jgi:anti-anti-sigma factor
VTTLRLQGEFDIATLPELQRDLGDAMAAPGDVVVDLAGLTFIDASSLHALSEAADRLRGTGRRLRLDHPSPYLCRLLRILDLGHLTA